MLKHLRNNSILYTILFAALLFRLPLINGSFWMDEAAQALEVVRPLSQQFDIVADFQPPLLHLILHFAQYFSHSEMWLRTIGALIPGLLTIIYSYKVAEKLFDKKVAIISSLLLATSTFHIFFSQELRPYSLPAFFGILSWYLMIRDEKKQNTNNLLTLSFITLAGLYSSYLYPFLIFSQIFYVLTQKKKTILYYAKSLLIPFFGFLPWLPMFLRQLNAGGEVREKLPGWDQVVSIPQLKAVPMVFAKFTYGLLNVDLNPFIVLTSIILVTTVSYLSYRYIFNKSLNGIQLIFGRKRNKSLSLLIIWLVVPLLTAWIISFIVPVIRPKRVLFLLPAFYIFISYLVVTAKDKLAQKAALLLIITMFGINFIGTFLYYTNPIYQRENWKELYNQINTDFDNQSTVSIYSFPAKFSPIEWYDKEELPSISTGYLYVNNVPDLANTLKKVVEYDTVLVFDYLRDLSDPDSLIEKELINFGFVEVNTLDYPNIGFVRIFIKPAARIGMN